MTEPLSPEPAAPGNGARALDPIPVPANDRAPARLRRKRRGSLVWLAVLVALVAAGIVYVRRRPTTSLPVRAHVVSRGDVRDLVTSAAAGRVTAEKEITLRAELSGSIRELRHRRGDRVTAGEPLVVYDAQELRERRSAAESAVALARAQAAQADANAALSRKTVERTERLHQSGSLPAAELDNARGQADATGSAADAAKASLAEAGANLGVARTALSKSVVKAPFSGLVLQTSVDQGDVVSPGVELLRMADVSKWYVDADIDEADLGRVALGMRAEVSLDAFANQRIVGALTEIAPAVNRDTHGSRSIAVRIELPADPRLRVGLSADVDIIVSTQPGVIWIPPNAVMGRGTDRSVYVVENGRAVKRSIATGISTWERVQVTSGLKEGDQIVTTLSNRELADGARVTAQVEPSREKDAR